MRWIRDFFKKPAKPVETKRVWVSVHGLAGCRAHGLRPFIDVYVPIHSPNQIYNLARDSADVRYELHIVDAMPLALEETAWRLPWSDIIMHDTEFDRGHCDDRMCVGDIRNRRR